MNNNDLFLVLDGTLLLYLVSLFPSCSLTDTVWSYPKQPKDLGGADGPHVVTCLGRWLSKSSELILLVGCPAGAMWEFAEAYLHG